MLPTAGCPAEAPGTQSASDQLLLGQWMGCPHAQGRLEDDWPQSSHPDRSLLITNHLWQVANSKLGQHCRLKAQKAVRQRSHAENPNCTWLVA